jgi:CheY-like chemotaxis protein
MKSLLVVDDEHDISECLRDILEEAGYRVRLARDGREGLARVSEERPDLIIADVMMPVMDGPEMIAKLDSEPSSRGIPIVLSTASRVLPPGTRHEGLLRKPFELDELFGVIETLLERQGRDVGPKASQPGIS